MFWHTMQLTTMRQVLLPVLVALFTWIIYKVLTIGRRDRNLPSGPPTLPIIGNAHLIPRKGAHFVFREMRKKYGDMFSLKIGPGTVIILSDRRIIKQVLDKGSATSSNRPQTTVAQMITGGHHLLTMDGSPEWRSFRKLVHQEVMERRCNEVHIAVQNAEAIQLLHDLVVFPDQHMSHPKRYSNSVIMSILFGVRTPSTESKHMQRLYDLMDHWSEVMEIGATPPVDDFPWLKYFPERLLGNWFSRTRQVHVEMNSLYGDLVRHVQRRREQKGTRDSFVDRVLDQNSRLGLTDHQLYFLAGVALEGGSDTSSAVITSCMQALSQFPEIQKKAQVEIDAVVDESRSPVWSDFAQLPYVTQVVKESQRWRPIGGLGFPHALTTGQWIDGKLLPKGASVFINLWDMHHDERRWEDHDVFDPDRYAGYTMLASEYANSSDYEKRDHYAFGNGRRLCPGIHLGERNIFLGIAKLLWAFRFEKATDSSGKPIDVDTDYETGYSQGFLINARPFPCKMTPRSKARESTIMREFAQVSQDVFSKYETGISWWTS
ncbi:hypothetical protein AWENTII_007721 [Aspergillus wentii]|nr:hypothetical protein MW887_011090 [Aspergillus wentii]